MYRCIYIHIYLHDTYVYVPPHLHTHVTSYHPCCMLCMNFIQEYEYLLEPKGACRNGGKPTTDMRTSTSVHTHVAATTEYTIYGIRVCNTYRACAELASNQKKMHIIRIHPQVYTPMLQRRLNAPYTAFVYVIQGMCRIGGKIKGGWARALNLTFRRPSRYVHFQNSSTMCKDT